MNFGAGISLLLPFGVSAQRSAAPLPVGETGGSKGKGGGQGGGSPTRQGGSEEPSCTPDLIRGKDGETPAAERAKPAIPSAREGRSPFRIWQPACTPLYGRSRHPGRDEDSLFRSAAGRTGTLIGMAGAASTLA
jgi:hypothetical protein